MAQLIPLYDRVIVRRVDELKTNSLIIIPDNAKEKPQQGEIISIGQGRLSPEGVLTPLIIQTGDKVLFGKYAGTEVTIEGEEVLIMREEEILGILQE